MSIKNTFVFLIKNDDKSKLRYIVKRNGDTLTVRSRQSFVIKIYAKNLIDSYEKLHKYICKRFLDLELEHIQIENSIYRDFDIDKHIEKNAFLTTEKIKNNKRKRLENKSGFVAITHKTFGRILFENKNDINKIGQKVNFLIPCKNNKYQYRQIMYDKKYFTNNSTRRIK